jgi:carboxypeptidase D
MVIGNGWISPPEQYMSYLPFAYESGVVEKGSAIAQKLEQQEVICQQALDQSGGHDHVDIPVCEQILQELLLLTRTKGSDESQDCVNMYDVRLRDSYPSCGMNWPPGLEYVTPYLRRGDVLRSLNVADAQQPGWVECNGAVGGAFRAQASKPSIQLMPELLAEIPTVLFSGASDLICNHLGTEELINNLEWNGGKGFEISPGNWAPRRDWEFEGEAAGIYQEARNLTYVLFYNSSHMVPFDYARRTRDMLDRFMNVDIAGIGGTPSNSLLDGEKGPLTSVDGHPNSTVAAEAEKARLEAAKWHAYYKSGEIVLVIVIVAAAVWGYYIFKARRNRTGYTGLFGGEAPAGGARGARGLESFRNKRTGRDVEAADFDESELDDLHISTPTEDMDRDRYSVGGASDSDDGDVGEKHGKTYEDKSSHGNGKPAARS